MSSIHRSEGTNIDALLKAAEVLEEKLYSHNHFDHIENSPTGLNKCSNIPQLKLNSLKEWFASGDLPKMDQTVTDHVGPQLRVDLASILKMSTQPGLDELQLIRDATEKLKKASALDSLGFTSTDLMFDNHHSLVVGPNTNARELVHRTAGTNWLRSTRLGETTPNVHLGNFAPNGVQLLHHHHHHHHHRDHHHQNRVITAASGLGHLVASSTSPGTVQPSEDDPDTVSNASEDLGLDNSSQDSFPGASCGGGVANGVANPSALGLNLPPNSDLLVRQARTNQPSSTCRLRTALLNSTGPKNPESQQQAGFHQLTDKPQNQQQQQQRKPLTNSPQARTSLVVSRKPLHRSATPTDPKPTPVSPGGHKSPTLTLPQTLRKCKSFTLRPQELSSWSAPPSVASANCGTPDKELSDPMSFSIPAEFTPNPNRCLLPNRPGRLSCSSLPVKKRKLDWKQQLESADESSSGMTSTRCGTSPVAALHHEPCSAPPFSTGYSADTMFKLGLNDSVCRSLSSGVRFSIGEGGLSSNQNTQNYNPRIEEQADPVCRRPHSIPAPLTNSTTELNEINGALAERRISHQFGPQSTASTGFNLLANRSHDLDATPNSLMSWDVKSSPTPPKYQPHSSVLARTLEASAHQPNLAASSLTSSESQPPQHQTDCKPVRLWIDTRLDGASIRDNRNLSTGSLTTNSPALKRLSHPHHYHDQRPPHSPNYYGIQTQQPKSTLGTNHHHHRLSQQHQLYGLGRSLSLNGPYTSLAPPTNPCSSMSLGEQRKSFAGGLIQDNPSDTVMNPTTAHPSTTVVGNGDSLADQQSPTQLACPLKPTTFSDLINSMISKQNVKELGDSFRDAKLDQLASQPGTYSSAKSDGLLNGIRNLSNADPDQPVLGNSNTLHLNHTIRNNCDKTDSNLSLMSKLSARDGAQVLMVLSASDDPTQTSRRGECVGSGSSNSSGSSSTHSSPTPALITPTGNANLSLVQGLTMTNRSTHGTASFPLLLVSASSSASAAAMAAAAALASGAPPTSLVPVPVQVTTYVPPQHEQTTATSCCQSSTNSTQSSANQRFILSVLPTDKSSSDRKIPFILSAPLFAHQPMGSEPNRPGDRHSQLVAASGGSTAQSGVAAALPALKCVPPMYEPTKAAPPAA